MDTTFLGETIIRCYQLYWALWLSNIVKCFCQDRSIIFPTNGVEITESVLLPKLDLCAILTKNSALQEKIKSLRLSDAWNKVRNKKNYTMECMHYRSFQSFLGFESLCVCVCVLGWKPRKPHGDYCPVHNYHDLFVNISFSVHLISF